MIFNMLALLRSPREFKESSVIQVFCFHPWISIPSVDSLCVHTFLFLLVLGFYSTSVDYIFRDPSIQPPNTPRTTRRTPTQVWGLILHLGQAQVQAHMQCSEFKMFKSIYNPGPDPNPNCFIPAKVVSNPQAQGFKWPSCSWQVFVSAGPWTKGSSRGI